jgi:hypothetical protein
LTTSSITKEVAGKRVAVIDKMVSSLRGGEDRQYFVGLVGYYIEGIPYPASGLSVDLGATQDIQRTADGFACIAMFPPHLLEPGTVKANATIKMNVAGHIREIVRVRLEAKLEDIWSITELVDGRQHTLFLDPETLKKRQGQFLL